MFTPLVHSFLSRLPEHLTLSTQFIEMNSLLLLLPWPDIVLASARAAHRTVLFE